MSEYNNIFHKNLERLAAIQTKIRGLEAEKKNIRQMLKATHNLLTDDEKKFWSDIWTTAIQSTDESRRGLTEAVKTVLQSDPKKWFSAIEVRDRLQESGHDFSRYVSNPLVSVHAVLKRFKRRDVKVKTMPDGSRYYRWARVTRVTASFTMQMETLKGVRSGEPSGPKKKE
jgi:hypothetical protein